MGNKRCCSTLLVTHKKTKSLTKSSRTNNALVIMLEMRSYACIKKNNLMNMFTMREHTYDNNENNKYASFKSEKK